MHGRLQPVRMQSTFRRIVGGVSDMSQIDRPEQWVCLPHSLKNRDCSDPEEGGQAKSPPCGKAKSETYGNEDRD